MRGLLATHAGMGYRDRLQGIFFLPSCENMASSYVSDMIRIFKPLDQIFLQYNDKFHKLYSDIKYAQATLS